MRSRQRLPFQSIPWVFLTCDSPDEIATYSDIFTASMTSLGRIYHHIVDTFEDVILDDLSQAGNKPAAALLRVFDD